MTSQKLRVGVIFGGQSGEHEVSLVSASSVITHLDKSKYEIVEIGITKEGQWISGPHTLKRFKQQQYNIATGQNGSVLSELASGKCNFDIIFPVLHGTYGEDGHIQGLLNILHLPFVGCDTLGSALSFDKVVTKQICETNQIQVVPYDWFYAIDWYKKESQVCKNLEKQFGYSMFIKPANLGSSVGISKAHNRKELLKAINLAFQYDSKVLVEQAVENAWEIECAVMGNFTPEISPTGRIVPSNEFYDYEAKYVDGKSETRIPSGLSVKLEYEVQQIARKAFKALNLRGLARLDFFVQTGSDSIYLNEANSLPGFTSISMYPKLWQAAGMTYNELLDKLIGLGLEIHASKLELSTSYETTHWFRTE